MMKINPGYVITILFIFYISFLAFAIYKSKGVDHSLVEDNYYEHDLAYQQHYDAIQNRKFLKQDLQITIQKSEKNILLDFGNCGSQLKGQINFYRPSKQTDDTTENFEINQSCAYEVSTRSLPSGRWKIKVSWIDSIRTYYKEEDLYLINP